MTLTASMWGKHGSVAAESAGLPFKSARDRGELIVGVPFLATPAAAGAKIRTPERLDTVAAARLSEQLDLRVKLVKVEPSQALAALADGSVDVILADQAKGFPEPGQFQDDAIAISAGYASQPKAVIRSDTPLRSWDQIKGRVVCMSTAAVAAQALAKKWGGQVRTFPVPSDALVGVRDGSCDIGLIDDTVWAPLMKFPEWKKFSASLPVMGEPVDLLWLTRAGDDASARWLAASMRQWRQQEVWQAMATKWARDVAFDVYLDQEVPDCHG